MTDRQVQSSIRKLSALLFIIIIGNTTSGQVEGNVVYLGLFPTNNKSQDKYMFHDYIPSANNLSAYRYDGKKVPLSLSDTFQVVGVLVGEYNNIKGDWIEVRKRANQVYDEVPYYLPLKADKITDVTYIRRNRKEKENAQFVLSHFLYLALACLPFVLIGWWVCFKENQLAKLISSKRS